MILLAPQPLRFDLGASMGGAELDYTPTIFQVEIDQAIMPVNSFKTRGNLLHGRLTQFQVALIPVAFATPRTFTTVLSGAITTPAAPVITTSVAAAPPTPTRWRAVTSTETRSPHGGDHGPRRGDFDFRRLQRHHLHRRHQRWGHLRLSGHPLRLFRQPLRDRLISPCTSASPRARPGPQKTTPDWRPPPTPNSASKPSTPNTDKASTARVRRSAARPGSGRAVDWTCQVRRNHQPRPRPPQQRASYKAIKVDFKREKIPELAKVSLIGIADTTQPVGQQAGFLIEER